MSVVQRAWTQEGCRETKGSILNTTTPCVTDGAVKRPKQLLPLLVGTQSTQTVANPVNSAWPGTLLGGIPLPSTLLNHQDFSFFFFFKLRVYILPDWNLPWFVFTWVLFGKTCETQKKGNRCLTQLTVTSSAWLLTTSNTAAGGGVCLFLNGAWFMLPSSRQDFC